MRGDARTLADLGLCRGLCGSCEERGGRSDQNQVLQGHGRARSFPEWQGESASAQSPSPVSTEIISNECSKGLDSETNSTCPHLGHERMA